MLKKGLSPVSCCALIGMTESQIEHLRWRIFLLQVRQSVTGEWGASVQAFVLDPIPDYVV